MPPCVAFNELLDLILPCDFTLLLQLIESGVGTKCQRAAMVALKNMGWTNSIGFVSILN